MSETTQTAMYYNGNWYGRSGNTDALDARITQTANNIAPRQISDTASKLIAVGEYFTDKLGRLCVCDVQIASGGSIVVGSNCHVISEGIGNALGSSGGEDYSTSPHVIGFKNNIYANLTTDTFESDIKQGHTYSMQIDGTGLYGAYVWYFYKKTAYGGFAIVMSSAKDYCFSVAIASDNVSIDGARRLA